MSLPEPPSEPPASGHAQEVAPWTSGPKRLEHVAEFRERLIGMSGHGEG